MSYYHNEEVGYEERISNDNTYTNYNNDNDNNDNDDDGGGNRPRRPNLETIEYLRGLPLDESTLSYQAAKQEINDYYYSTEIKTMDNIPTVFTVCMTALEEVQHEIASLAGHELASQRLEFMIQVTCPFSKSLSCLVLKSCRGYMNHLSTHRYGSHVLQTILQCTSQNDIINNNNNTNSLDLANIMNDNQTNHSSNNNNNNDSIIIISNLRNEIVQEILPQLSQHIVHVCATHVLRTLICILGGVELVPSQHYNNNNNNANRRGKFKSKKKKKKKKQSMEQEQEQQQQIRQQQQQQIQLKYTNNMQSSSIDLDLLNHITDTLLNNNNNNGGTSNDDLPTLVCHVNAGPFINLLLQVLTYSHATNDFKQNHFTTMNNKNNNNNKLGTIDLTMIPNFTMNSKAHSLCLSILGWNKSGQQVSDEILFDLAGNNIGSHVIETILQLSPDPFYSTILDIGKFIPNTSMPSNTTTSANPSSTIQDYIQDDIGNYIIQMILVTIRTAEQAMYMFQQIEKLIISDAELLLSPHRRRRGILWRVTELAVRYPNNGQDMLCRAIRIGFGKLQQQQEQQQQKTMSDEKNNQNDNNNNNEETAKKKKKKQRQKALAMELTLVIPKLLNVQLPNSDTSNASQQQQQNVYGTQNITLDVAGTRTVYNMLQFTPLLSGEVFKGIIQHVSSQELFLIAKDGVGSRCILDGMIMGIKNNEQQQKALFEKLNDYWISLAMDRIGHRVVMNYLSTCINYTKSLSRLADLMDKKGAKTKLAGNVMGRNVLKLLCLDILLQKDKSTWEKEIKKQLQLYINKEREIINDTRFNNKVQSKNNENNDNNNDLDWLLLKETSNDTTTTDGNGDNVEDQVCENEKQKSGSSNSNKRDKKKHKKEKKKHKRKEMATTKTKATTSGTTTVDSIMAAMTMPVAKRKKIDK